MFNERVNAQRRCRLGCRVWCADVGAASSIKLDGGEGGAALPGLVPSPSRAEGVLQYSVSVETGSEMGAGTDGDVWIVLVGSLGESTPFKLDRFLMDDHEKGSVALYDMQVGLVNFWDL